MKVKKLLSTVAALAIAASSFAGLGISANAATVKYTADWSGLTAIPAIDTLGTGWNLKTDWEVTEKSSPLSAADGQVSVKPGSKNNTYLYYAMDTIANSENRVYKISFNYKSSTGTATKNNYFSEIAALAADTVTNYSQMAAWGNPKDIGATDTSKTYLIEMVINNVTDKVTYAVDGTVKAEFATGKTAVSGVVFRTGRALTDTISNFKAYELDMPTMTFDKDTVTLDIASTSLTKSDDVTATLGADTEIKSAVSSNKDVADASVNGTKITITGGTKAGDATITVTAAKTGTGADEFETVTKTIPVTVNNSAAAACDLTLNYVDAKDTTKVLKSAKASADAFVNVAYELTEAEKADFEYTDTDKGVVYTATVTSTSVTPDAATDTCNVLCTLTEKTYAATITTAPYAKVVLSGTTKSGAEYAGETIYSDYTGKATTNLKQGTYNAAVTKGGYNASTTNALTVTTAGGTVNADLTIKDSANVYYEDFNTTGLTGNPELFGTPAGEATFRLNSNTMEAYSKGNGTRNSTMTFNKAISVTEAYRISFDMSGIYMNGDKTGDWQNDISFIDSDDKVIFTISPTFTTGKVSTGLKVNDTVVTTDDLGSKTLTVTADVVGNKVTVKVGSYDAVTFTTEAGNTIKGIKQVNSKLVCARIDNLVVSNIPAITSVATAAAAGDDFVVAEPVGQELTAVTDGVIDANYDDIKGDMTLTTVYIKVANPVDGVAPALKIGTDTYKATYAGIKDYNGYYVYQILAKDAIDLAKTAHTVTYEGAADYSFVPTV